MAGGTDILKQLICQNCGGHIDRHTLQCPYCETQYNGELQQMPKIIYGERRDYDVLNASVCIDEKLFLENQALAQKIAMEKLTQVMMKGLEPYIEIKEHQDHRSFSRYITGAIRIYRK